MTHPIDAIYNQCIGGDLPPQPPVTPATLTDAAHALRVLTDPPPMPAPVRELVEAAEKLSSASPVNRWSKQHIDGTVAAIAAVRTFYSEKP